MGQDSSYIHWEEMLQYRGEDIHTPTVRYDLRLALPCERNTVK